MLHRYKAEGNATMVRRLENAPFGNAAPLSDSYLKVRDVTMHELGVGTMHKMRSIVTGLFLTSLLNREYTLREKLNLWRGKIFAGDLLWNTQLATHLTTTVTSLEMPVYFFTARMTTPFPTHWPSPTTNNLSLQ
jgi:hypothetical protein